MSETVNDQTLAFSVNNKTPTVRFLASLSDGRTVIQDDRPKERHAWVRLSAWIKSNPTISITGLRLQGPKGIDIKMPKDQSGYFFGMKQQVVWGSGQQNHVGIGYYDGQDISISWYRQPDFDNSFAENRTVAKAGFFLIKNH